MRLNESLMKSGMSSGQQGVLMKRGSIDLINCQVGRSELSSCQVGNEKRSAEYPHTARGAVMKVQIARWAMRWDHWIS
jgi:hypothetical protein